MNRYWTAAVTFAAALSLGSAAAPFAAAQCPHCPPQQIVYQDIVTHRCKLVPETKQIKKTVYEVKEVPFCLPRLPHFLSLFQHKCCEECPECECPRYRRVLVKREIVCEEVCGTKCVVEEVVERVPCRVCVPACSHCGAGP